MENLEINDFEKDMVLPLLVHNFKIKIKKGFVGKDNAVKSDLICSGISTALKAQGQDYSLTAVKLRRLIGVIRQSGYVPALCSCSKGYYVASTVGELDKCIESLSSRISQQRKVVDALIEQKKAILTKLNK